MQTCFTFAEESIGLTSTEVQPKIPIVIKKIKTFVKDFLDLMVPQESCLPNATVLPPKIKLPAAPVLVDMAVNKWSQAWVLIHLEKYRPVSNG